LPKAPAAPPEWPLPFRLRHVLALGVLGLAASWVVPRARAAWDIHALGAALGDYAVCMAGPTGPELLRDDARAFRRLVRRRLVAAPPTEAPFAKCAKAALEVSGEPELESLHRGEARHFAEYGATAGAVDRDAISLDKLGIDATRLVERSRQAWPFVRGSTARLIHPSLGAREAVHPVAPAEPSFGRGLVGSRGLPKNAWRAAEGFFVGIGNAAGQSLFFTSDGGASFRAVPRAAGADERVGRCSGDDPKKSFTLSSASDGSLLVSSVVDGQSSEAPPAIRGEHRLFAVACDDEALVIAARREGGAGGGLVLCPFARSCAPIQLPQVAPFSPLMSDEIDIARVQGATVLVVETQGIVRVLSSRDDGVTWTPPSVAFDRGEFPAVAGGYRPPARLLRLGSRLLLYGAAARSGQPYLVLASDDQGASFRSLAPAPRPATEPPRVAAGAPR
jgi:hypothetical protein